MPRNEFDQPIGEPLTWSPRPVVGPVRLVGEHCVLEPYAAAHLEELYEATVVRSPASTWTYLAAPPLTGPADLGSWMDVLVTGMGAVPLTIRLPDGAVVGTASYLRRDHANGSVEVGGITYAAELQRTTAATEAMYLMMRHAFDDLGYRRYEWKCDSLNEPSRRAALRLGFTYEGTHRNAQVYKSRNRDTDWFSVTDQEWPARRAGFEAWLAPGNFGADGAQRSPLRF